MTRPLYKTAVHRPEKRDPDGHTGLWFDKFCDKWRRNGTTWTMKGDGKSDPKLEWIHEIAKSKSPTGDSGEIEEYAMRLMRLVEKRGGRVSVFTTESRFVTGLGRSHPIENGFAWHPTLGTPYLPGSSVKGMVRAWAEAEAEPGRDESARERSFGSAGNAGSVCFLDALPVAPVRLDTDVMTPHYAGWSANEPPGDWMSPTPIPFLAVAAGTSFLFAFVPGRVVPAEDLNAVGDWLGAALAWAGGGAKTAVGYGRFRCDSEKTASWTERVKAERQRQNALKSPTGRWRLDLEGKTEAEILDRVRIHLQKERLADSTERRAFAEAVFALRPDWVERWRIGDKHDRRTRVGSKKLRERARLLDEVTAETVSSRKQPD